VPEPPFSISDAHEICLAPYLDAALRREAARRTAACGEAARSAGVSWSGLGPGSAPAPRKSAEIHAEAEDALARAIAFTESPRGRFLLAVQALEKLGYAAPAEKAHSAFARGLADPGRPACPAEIGAALAILARLDEPDARAACLALAELLCGSLGLAAE
jgi:hypothetical protein